MQEVKGGREWLALSQSKKSVVVQRKEMTEAVLAEAPHSEAQNSAAAHRGFRYANINYVILGSVLETVYKESWEDHIKKAVFKPLTMQSCGFGVAGNPAEIEPSQPWPHLIVGGKLVAAEFLRRIRARQCKSPATNRHQKHRRP